MLFDNVLGIVFGKLGPLSIQEVFDFDTLFCTAFHLLRIALSRGTAHSLRNAVTGLALADLIVRMLIVSRAKPIMAAPARGKIHQLTGAR